MVKSLRSGDFHHTLRALFKLQKVRLHISESNIKRQPPTLGENLHTQRLRSVEKKAERDTAFSHTRPASYFIISVPNELTRAAGRGKLCAHAGDMQRSTCCGNVDGILVSTLARPSQQTGVIVTSK